MGFDEFFGNESAVKSLKNAVEKGRISNSYVFEGIGGIGKRLCAEIFARSIVCESSNKPCDACPSCKKAKTYNHPDILYLEKPKDKASIGVDDIREKILNEVYLKPYLSDRRIFIIDDGDALSVEAQNALLKVLEEPPDNVSFIICVKSTDRLLNTVLSRSFVVSFFPLSSHEIYSYIKNDNIQDKDIELIARLSQGSIGEARELLQNDDTLLLFENSVKSTVALKGDASQIRETADFLIEDKENVQKKVDFMQTFIRDCVFVKSNLEDLVIYKNKLSDMRVFCGAISKKGLVSAFDEITDFKLKLTQNLNYNALVLNTAMRIWEDFHDKGCGHKI